MAASAKGEKVGVGHGREREEERSGTKVWFSASRAGDSPSSQWARVGFGKANSVDRTGSWKRDEKGCRRLRAAQWRNSRHAYKQEQ